MPYTKTTWVSGGPPGIDADKLNNLETQYDAAKADLDAHTTRTDNPHATTAAQVGALPSTGGTVSGAVTIQGNTTIESGSVEVGRQDGVSSTPYIDFHSGATAVDYDTRIIASGGTGAVGGGTLNVIASSFLKSGNAVWHAGNDGAGSGLDADTLDGIHASGLAKIATGTYTGDGGSNRKIVTGFRPRYLYVGTTAEITGSYGYFQQAIDLSSLLQIFDLATDSTTISTKGSGEPYYITFQADGFTMEGASPINQNAIAFGWFAIY
jgi:hypothetical protein